MQFPLEIGGNRNLDDANATRDETMTCIFGELGDYSRAITLPYLLCFSPVATHKGLPTVISRLLEVLEAFEFVKSTNPLPILIGVIIVCLGFLKHLTRKIVNTLKHLEYLSWRRRSFREE